MQLLAEAFRKYTDHDAVHVNAESTYLAYDADVCLKRGDTVPDDDFDFFVLSEFLPGSVAMNLIFDPVADRLSMNRYNTIIRTNGSMPRNHHLRYRHKQIKNGWMYAGGYHDISISSKMFVAPIPSICPIDKIPPPTPMEGEVCIAFAPTKPEKGIDVFVDAVGRLEDEYDIVHGVPIYDKSWAESIMIKSKCNVTFDQVMIPTYGNSAIESMWLGHTVFSKIDEWTRFLYPHLPIDDVTDGDDLYNSIEKLVNSNNHIPSMGCEFVERVHHPELVVKRWQWLIKYVQKKER